MGIVEDAADLVEQHRQATPESEAGPALGGLFHRLDRSDTKACRGVMAALAKGIDAEAPDRALLFATACGALVEGGHDPEVMGAPLVRCLSRLVPQALAFHTAAGVAAREAGSTSDEDDDEAFEAAAEALAPRLPSEHAAWRALGERFAPAIALFSASPSWRAEGRALATDLAAMGRHSEGAHWISRLLAVLHAEPFVAIEPSTSSGLVGRMSGIADNFQLQVLLMDALPRRGLLARRRVSRAIVEIAEGRGRQTIDEAVEGAWNMYDWRAARADGSLASDGTSCWIWGEGTPADIPTFEGARIILLGPPSYVRTWGAQRLFANLPASLEVERALSKAEVSDWLARLAAR